VTEPVRLVLVSGHTFGCRAFEGIFASGAFLDGRVEAGLMIGLSESRAVATVGYQSLCGLAASQGVEYAGTADGRLRSLAGRIEAARPDYLLVIGWSYLVPSEVLALATGGGIGMHPTMLPLGRGQAPIPWSIIKGCTRTALTVFFLAAAVDSGPVIAQHHLGIRDRETSASLFYRMAQAHFTAGFELGELLGSHGRRAVPAVPQDEALATRWPRRRPRDGEILSTMSCPEIDRLVRAQLGPYPRAFVRVDGEQLPIRAVSATAAAGLVRFRGRDGEVWLVPDVR
jgi:methionyl-tRNA formyltransferase